MNSAILCIDVRCRMLSACQCAQCLQVASMSRVRGNVVLHFLAGGRALGVLSDMLLREARLNAVRHQAFWLAWLRTYSVTHLPAQRLSMRAQLSCQAPISSS